MLRYLGLSCILLFFLFSCSKKDRIERKLDGEWRILSYKRTNNEGLSFFSTGNGKIKISCNRKTNLKTIQLDIYYHFQNDSATINTNCNFDFTSKKADYIKLVGPTQWMNLQDTLTARILVSTRTNLELEVPDKSGQIHTFIGLKN